MSPKKTLSSRLINRYLLIIRNEENLAEKTTFSFTYAKLIVFSFLLFVVLLVMSLFLVKTVLSQWFDPVHAEQEMKRNLVQLYLDIDSMDYELQRKDRFIANIQRVISGEGMTEAIDTQTNAQTNKIANEEDIYQLPQIDSQFRKEFEASGISLLPAVQVNTDFEDLFFFSPISGIISSPFDPNLNHYGVDVVAKKNEPVQCVADGTVIFSTWTQSGGNVIAVQHRNNIISVYKHNSALLKKEGEIVKAGDIISIIGNTGELTTGPHLHFEVWHNGNPVNPENYVSF